MGKQINYWMDYDNFLLLARKARTSELLHLHLKISITPDM